MPTEQGRYVTYEEIIGRLEDRITKLEAALMFETDLRGKNPVLQDLYDQYMMARALTDE